MGLVTGTCLSEFGLRVLCMDVDRPRSRHSRTAKFLSTSLGWAPFSKNLEAGRLRFTTDIAEAVAESSMIFIAVGTPPGENGTADTKHVFAAAASIAEHISDSKIIVNKSTVPVGTGRKVKNLVRRSLIAADLPA